MTADEGASPAEQIVEAVRRNNVELLTEVVEAIDDVEARAKVINEARDAIGNSPMHIGAYYGSYEALDYLLDQEGVEVDPINRLERDSPLHSVVRYAKTEPEHGTYIAEMLIDAGCDARIRNKAGQKPLDLVDDSNDQLIEVLQRAEFAMAVGPTKEEDEDEVDENGTGNGAESE